MEKNQQRPNLLGKANAAMKMATKTLENHNREKAATKNSGDDKQEQVATESDEAAALEKSTEAVASNQQRPDLLGKANAAMKMATTTLDKHNLQKAATKNSSDDEQEQVGTERDEVAAMEKANAEMETKIREKAAKAKKGEKLEKIIENYRKPAKKAAEESNEQIVEKLFGENSCCKNPQKTLVKMGAEKPILELVSVVKEINQKRNRMQEIYQQPFAVKGWTLGWKKVKVPLLTPPPIKAYLTNCLGYWPSSIPALVYGKTEYVMYVVPHGDKRYLCLDDPKKFGRWQKYTTAGMIAHKKATRQKKGSKRAMVSEAVGADSSRQGYGRYCKCGSP